MRKGWVRSAATPARGGLALTFARKAMAAECGLDIDVGACPEADALAPDAFLFSESNGRFVVTTSGEHAAAFAEAMRGHACVEIGKVTAEPNLIVRRGDERWIDRAVPDLKAAFRIAVEVA